MTKGIAFVLQFLLGWMISYLIIVAVGGAAGIGLALLASFGYWGAVRYLEGE